MRGFRVGVVGGLTAAVVVVCAAVLAVMAIGAPVNSAIPPESGTWKVMPSVSVTGGQNTDCAVFGSAAPYWYRIDNPQTLANGYSTTAPDGTPVNFKLQVDTSGPKKDKYFNWQATGANVYDVGVKGGSDTARYAYTKAFDGVLPPDYTYPGALNGLKPVFSDTGLHATLDNQNRLFNLSNVTFCYGTGSVISGTVFDDANANNAKDTGEAGLSGRAVRLYAGTATTTTATTDAAGNYSFTAAVGQDYRVCLVAAEGRKQTLSGTAQCKQGPAMDERAFGYAVSNLNGNVEALNFGEAALVTLGGKVFSDWNGNRTMDGAGTATDPADTAQTDRTVRLYVGNSQSYTTAPTTSGTFTFADLPAGAEYRVCLVADARYEQSTPTDSTPNCGSGERSYGFAVTPAADRNDLNFGETPYVSIGGTVYDDANQNAVRNVGESGLAGWEVRLHAGSTVTNATSQSDGTYSISVLSSATGAFRLCESPPGSALYAQTQPSPVGPTICNSGTELAKGYSGTDLGSFPKASLTDVNFGNRAAVPCTSPMGPADYVIQLATCKNDARFVFDSGLVSGTGTSLDGSPFVSVFASGPDTTPTPMVEKITLGYGSNLQNKLKLMYTDDFPFVTANLTDMLYCRLDPRDSTELGLRAPYTSIASAASVLPTETNGVTGQPHTSCLISTTEYVTAGGVKKYVAYVFSSIDGYRVGTG